MLPSFVYLPSLTSNSDVHSPQKLQTRSPLLVVTLRSLRLEPQFQETFPTFANLSVP